MYQVDDSAYLAKAEELDQARQLALERAGVLFAEGSPHYEDLLDMVGKLTYLLVLLPRVKPNIPQLEGMGQQANLQWQEATGGRVLPTRWSPAKPARDAQVGYGERASESQGSKR